MNFKVIAGIVAAALMIGYVAPTVFKIKEVSLTIVLLVGVVMMLIDLWQSLQSKGD